MLPWLAVGQVPHSVGVCGQVRPVEGQVRAEVRDGLVEPGENTVKAVRERRAVLTELDREPVRGVDAGSDTERILKGGVLGDKPDGAGPRWDHVHALGERDPTIARIG